MGELKQTALIDLHLALGGKMVNFAGWEMPVQYPLGVMKEHLHCRAAAGLFDVSHMGQLIVRAGAEALEALMPVDVAALPEGRQRYGFLTNDHGGIIDDLMFTNRGDHYLFIVNAANAEADTKYLRKHLGDAVEPIYDRALLALQGPDAEDVLGTIAPDTSRLRFMDMGTFDTDFGTLWISRSGYTGDDGFEISVKNEHANDLARALLSHEQVEPIGLGARDSLRLEAGLPLHGSDMDAGLNPVEASLSWAIQKVRRKGGARAGGFPGEEQILSALVLGAERCRVGLAPEGRAPMRREVALFTANEGGDQIGVVTSGGFGPSVGAPVSMGIVAQKYSTRGTHLYGEVRGKRLPVSVVPMPFRPATFKR
ncbi:glycine cleavage system aminomethyltransferase GcvT [Maritimibacter dapengensis]|uniref:aminomethyltransferase n=1 Tax=Maritimibacter dapengensis TaxID=2836868 RepID=A0ABS6T7Y9_9RHOB|nr:glycine cleavage system aminomethyltransferase GcvT [Maritimibacter dapengensis]MBV7380681.1 glycine cleavage system aminomethyltransferase GcvT [Maritimibacter dapengensis]